MGRVGSAFSTIAAQKLGEERHDTSRLLRHHSIKDTTQEIAHWISVKKEESLHYWMTVRHGTEEMKNVPIVLILQENPLV